MLPIVLCANFNYCFYCIFPLSSVNFMWWVILRKFYTKLFRVKIKISLDIKDLLVERMVTACIAMFTGWNTIYGKDREVKKVLSWHFRNYTTTYTIFLQFIRCLCAGGQLFLCLKLIIFMFLGKINRFKLKLNSKIIHCH